MTHPRLQFLGPATLFIAIFCAEGATWALGQYPSSQLLWYVNLQLFGIFQKSYYQLSYYLDLPYLQLLLVALPILALGLVGLLGKKMLPLAIASNLSFVYAAFLIFSWLSYEMAPRSASLGMVLVSSSQTFYLPFIVAAASLVSFALSHFHYVRTLRASA